jgi:hypothetical protein
MIAGMGVRSQMNHLCVYYTDVLPDPQKRAYVEYADHPILELIENGPCVGRMVPIHKNIQLLPPGRDMFPPGQVIEKADRLLIESASQQASRHPVNAAISKVVEATIQRALYISASATACQFVEATKQRAPSAAAGQIDEASSRRAKPLPESAANNVVVGATLRRQQRPPASEAVHASVVVATNQRAQRPPIDSSTTSISKLPVACIQKLPTATCRSQRNPFSASPRVRINFHSDGIDCAPPVQNSQTVCVGNPVESSSSANWPSNGTTNASGCCLNREKT